MAKSRLLTPGPTQVPEQARLALAREVKHHRTAEFRAQFAEANDGLRYVCQTRGDVVTLTCSGTGAMEAAVVNTAPRGGKVIVVESGVFSRRWREIAEAFGVEVVRLDVPWGEAAASSDLAALLKQHPDCAAVFTTLMESSTGVAHDIRALGEVTKSTDALFVVDGISGVGAIECRADDWGIDVLVVGSQKALMLPPGLAFLAVSDQAWRRMEEIQPQAFYFDLMKHRRKLREGPDTPWTPNHVLIGALVESLRLVRSAGIESLWRRSTMLARAARAGFDQLGLKQFAQRPADGMTTVCVPTGVDGGELLRRIEQRFGVKLAGGQDKLKGKIFRIAHFGLVDELDTIGALAALEIVLAEMGQKVSLGSAVAAASQVLLDAPSPE